MNARIGHAKVHVGPGKLHTGRHRYTCDAAVLEAVVEVDDEGKVLRFLEIEIEQLHDINLARRRTKSEVREHLRACVRLLSKEGAIVEHEDELYYVRPSGVSVSKKLSLHAYHRADEMHGPFSDTPSGSSGG